jgi:CPA2 family monovalent cation:H+ antiporter-2
LIEKELSTLVLLFVFAIIGGILANRFKQPVVLGFLLVGTLIGPFAFNLVNDEKMINMMIDFGAILLLFVVGLEFSVKKLMNMGAKALIIGAFKIGIMFFFGYCASILFGLGVTTGIFIGIIFSFTSTVVVVKILEQKDMIKKQEVPLLLAVLIIEDVIAVVLLTLLSGVEGSAGGSPIIILEKLVINITILIVVYLILSRHAEKLLGLLTKNANEEMITFISLALCAGFAYLAYVLGISPSAGAFLAGSVISSVKDSKAFEKSVMPHNLMFSSLFFIAMGTLIDLRAIVDNLWLILGLLGVLIVARLIAVGLSVYLFGNMRREQPIFSSIALLSVGEFSLLIAKEAKMFNVTIDLVTITAILIFMTSLLMSFGVKSSQKIYTALEKERPGRFKRKLGSLGDYIGSFLQQLDTESTFTNRFKKYLAKTVGLFFAWLFVLIGMYELTQFLIKQNAANMYVYAAYLLFGTMAVFLLYLIYTNGKEVYSLCVKITSINDKSMNLRRADKALKYMSIGMLIVLVGLISPGFVFVLGGSAIHTWIPVGIVVLGLFIMSRVFGLLVHFSNDYSGYVPEYKKYNPDVVRFNNRKY